MVCQACSTARRLKVLDPTVGWRRRVSKTQGRNNTRREAGPERSVEQRREPMNKNRIGGLRWRASKQRIAKPISIKLTGGVNPAVARRKRLNLPWEICGMSRN